MFSKRGLCPQCHIEYFLSLKRLLHIVSVQTGSGVGSCPQRLCGVASICPFYSLPPICIFAGFDLGSQLSFAGRTLVFAFFLL